MQLYVYKGFFFYCFTVDLFLTEHSQPIIRVLFAVYILLSLSMHTLDSGV